MYPFTLKKTKEKHYCCLPGPVADKLVPWFEKNGVEYEIFSEEEIPDTVPLGCVFYGGRKVMFGCAYVYCNLDPKELTETAEIMFRLPRSAFSD